MRNSTHRTHLAYRPDIDGLRALAILLVIVFHAFPKFLRGGFIGVDIFFVISGYLITSIIIRGQSQGSFSLLEFYSRRIKRIFPALIVVLVFCLIVGWYVLFADEYQQLGKHIAAGSIYLSNIVLESESGYFDTDAERKPLLHLWSLGIEEQFYLVFPLLLIFSFRFNFSPFLTILLCLVASFTFNVLNVNDKPTEVFFYPYTRSWELLVGSLIAFHHHPIKNRVKIKNLLSPSSGYNSNLANGLAWFGFVLIFVAWIFLDSRKILFPSWWALIPTLGAACLILAGEKAWFNRKILASKLAVFIGLISYPLCLWHWVLLSFVNITEMESPSALLKITVLITSVALAWGTYFFVEKNLRFQKPKAVSIGLFVSLAFVGSLGYLVLQQNGYPNRYVPDPSFVAGEIGNGSYKAKGWLSSKACIDKYAKIAFGKYPDDEFCLIQDPKTPPTALLIGDSHANHLYSGLLENMELTGGNLLNLGGPAVSLFLITR